MFLLDRAPSDHEAVVSDDESVASDLVEPSAQRNKNDKPKTNDHHFGHTNLCHKDNENLEKKSVVTDYNKVEECKVENVSNEIHKIKKRVVNTSPQSEPLPKTDSSLSSNVEEDINANERTALGARLSAAENKKDNDLQTFKEAPPPSKLAGRTLPDKVVPGRKNRRVDITCNENWYTFSLYLGAGVAIAGAMAYIQYRGLFTLEKNYT